MVTYKQWKMLNESFVNTFGSVLAQPVVVGGVVGATGASDWSLEETKARIRKYMFGDEEDEESNLEDNDFKPKKKKSNDVMSLKKKNDPFGDKTVVKKDDDLDGDDDLDDDDLDGDDDDDDLDDDLDDDDLDGDDDDDDLDDDLDDDNLDGDDDDDDLDDDLDDKDHFGMNSKSGLDDDLDGDDLDDKDRFGMNSKSGLDDDLDSDDLDGDDLDGDDLDDKDHFGMNSKSGLDDDLDGDDDHLGAGGFSTSARGHVCEKCGHHEPDKNSKFCKMCGTPISINKFMKKYMSADSVKVKNKKPIDWLNKATDHGEVTQLTAKDMFKPIKGDKKKLNHEAACAKKVKEHKICATCGFLSCEVHNVPSPTAEKLNKAFFKSLTGQIKSRGEKFHDGLHSSVVEDALYTPKTEDQPQEPGPGEVGYAPQGRVVNDFFRN